MNHRYIKPYMLFERKIKISTSLFHGSNSCDLKTLQPFTNKYHNIPPSIFLTNKKRVAKDYGRCIYKCELSCRNIKEIDVNGKSFHDYRDFEYEISMAHDDGFECVIFRNIMDSKEPNTTVPLSDIYVVFDSNNVDIVGKYCI